MWLIVFLTSFYFLYFDCFRDYGKSPIITLEICSFLHAYWTSSRCNSKSGMLQRDRRTVPASSTNEWILLWLVLGEKQSLASGVSNWVLPRPGYWPITQRCHVKRRRIGSPMAGLLYEPRVLVRFPWLPSALVTLGKPSSTRSNTNHQTRVLAGLHRIVTSGCPLASIRQELALASGVLDSTLLRWG